MVILVELIERQGQIDAHVLGKQCLAIPYVGRVGSDG
jgi:hypothetical protein